MVLPNLVIAGAPKCGTSSLFNWLADHPDICGSTVKELFFLMDHDHPLRAPGCNFHDHGLDAYSDCFPEFASEQRIRLEATTHYIYQQTALEVLGSMPGQPRLLFLLRKPSERLFSSFNYSKTNGNIRGNLSFRDFIRLISAEPSTRTLQRAFGPAAYVLGRELQHSAYVDYLCRWRERVGKDRMRILLFETMREQPRRVVEEICDWLGIDRSFYEDYDFKVSNRTIRIRSAAAHRVARSAASLLPPRSAPPILKMVYRVLQAKSDRIVRTSEDDKTLAELDERFRPADERLAREFSLDLESWR